MTDPILLLLIGVVIVVGSIIGLRLHPFLALLLGTIAIAMLTGTENLQEYALSKNLSPEATKKLITTGAGTRIAEAFGSTLGKIGILIALASIIANSLYRSGAADKIIRSLVRLTGEKHAAFAFLGGSFTLGIPVFFDTVFYLMFPLARTLALRTRKNYGLYLMAIIGGGVMAHSLVPPTPGPLYMAAELKVSIGLMMVMGIFVGTFTSLAGYLYAQWANRKWPLSIERLEASVKEGDQPEVSETDLPSLGLSMVPIVLPVILISGSTILDLIHRNELFTVSENLLVFFKIAGNSNLALALAAAFGLILLIRSKGSKSVKANVQEALQDAGVLILIIGAGGAFGSMLEQTGISSRISAMFELNNVTVLPIIFIISALVRTAQGSATISMITTVGMVSGLTDSLSFHPVYIAMVIGCGSKIFNWMNDSSFWVTCKMSGMTERETVRNNSVLLTVMGIAGLIVIMVMAWLFPMVG